MLVVGPDGSGKSAVADELAALAGLYGIPVRHGHHRPGLLLPAVGGATTNVERPHDQQPRSLVSATAKLLAVLADSTVGYAFTWHRVRRGGLMIVERGWFDMAVDPRRYRLPPALAPVVLALGRLVPPADLVVVLAGDATAIHARKSEIGVDEVKRQTDTWPGVAGRATRRVVQIDSVANPPEVVATQAWRELAAETAAREWRKVPFGPARLEMHVWGSVSPSAWLQRSYRLTPRLFDPLRPALAALGPRRQVGGPLLVLPGLCATLGFAPSGLLAMRSSTPGRWIVGMSVGRTLTAVFKIGQPDDERLRSEAAVLAVLSGDRSMAGVPPLLWAGEHEGFFVVATRAVEVHRHERPSLEQVRALCSEMVRGTSTRPPLVHGDLAPWNVTLGASGVSVFDWEYARWQQRPLRDLAHYLVQSGALLGTYSPAVAVRLLTAQGSPGWRHLLECDVDPTRGRQLLCDYLDTAPSFAATSGVFRAAMARCLAP